MHDSMGGLPGALVVAALLVAAEAAPSQRAARSDDEILSYLPLASKVASVPGCFAADRSVKESRRGVVSADTDGDGMNEVIVAYYTAPHEYRPNQGRKPHQAFARRAHVRVLKWDGTTWREQWDSGGYGMEFRARMPTEVVEAKPEVQRPYTECFFAADDINGDGLADIMFTRSSYLSEGAAFEVWTWDRVQYRRIATCRGPVRIDDARIISEYDQKGIRMESARVLTWDGRQFVEMQMANPREQ